jgi:hypothetical protein
MRARTLLTASVMLAATLLCSTARSFAQSAPATARQKAAVTTTAQVDFISGGVVDLRNSFGDVRVEGWDRPEVEISVTKSTRKKYAPADQASGFDQLEDVQVALAKQSDRSILITTHFPSRHPLRLLQGKTNLQLTYRIRVPQQSALFINHDRGDIAIRNISGDIQVNNRFGGVKLDLLDEAGSGYTFDARSRLGGISSEFFGEHRWALIWGESLETKYRRRTHRINLRVGIGDILINKLNKDK